MPQAIKDVKDQMRLIECPACHRMLTFELLRAESARGPGLSITAGHEHPSCDWYKAFPDSESVARAVGLLLLDTN